MAEYEKAAAAIRGGRFPEAQRILEQILHEHPHEVFALSLLGVTLDAQKRFDEAEGYYQRALNLSPRSASVLNNLGNHYLQRGDREKASEAYLRVIAVSPRHPNANRQLAELSVSSGQGAAALGYLDRLPLEDQNVPAIRIVRAQALRLAGREKEGADVLGSIEAQAVGDPRLTYSLGLIYAEWKRYDDAERAFSKALEASPADFDILFNLGLAALRNGHFDRAKEVFEIALRQRPNDVEVLQNLARVAAARGEPDLAIVILVQAEKLAPNDADLQLFLARMAEQCGYYGDAATAYDRYYKLRPDEDVIRRDRGFALARSAKIDKGLEDLRWYVQKHPEDARGWYLLGVAETVGDRDRALECLNQAIDLDPKFLLARYARGVAYMQGGQLEKANEDLEFVVARDPKDAYALDALGRTRLKLNQPEEAVDLFRRAVEIDPKDRRMLMHYATALQRAGRREEAKAAFDRFKIIGPDEYARRAKGGLFEYLKLPPDQQRDLYMTHLRASLTTKPDDPNLQVKLGKAMLMEGKLAAAQEAFRTVQRLTDDPDIYADCATTLLDSEQYALAKEFLTRLVAARPDSVSDRLDLAIAAFHSESAEAGLAELDKIRADKRNGDYFLLRAQILDNLGRSGEAAKDLDRGLAAEPTRPDLYFQGALFLLKHKDYEPASRLLAQAVSKVPDSPELQLTQAIVLGILRRHEAAQELLTQIEARWPEWSMPYLVHGIMLETQLHYEKAKPLLETAISLGAGDSIAYYYLALSSSNATPNELNDAVEAINKAVELNPNDAYIRSLAAKIAYMREDYSAAIEHADAALRAWPDMIEAHQTLSAVYRARGEREKVAAQLKEILRIKQATRDADQSPPFPTGDLLFTVRPPAVPPS